MWAHVHISMWVHYVYSMWAGEKLMYVYMLYSMCWHVYHAHRTRDNIYTKYTCGHMYISLCGYIMYTLCGYIIVHVTTYTQSTHVGTCTYFYVGTSCILYVGRWKAHVCVYVIQYVLACIRCASYT